MALTSVQYDTLRQQVSAVDTAESRLLTSKIALSDYLSSTAARIIELRAAVATAETNKTDAITELKSGGSSVWSTLQSSTNKEDIEVFSDLSARFP